MKREDLHPNLLKRCQECAFGGRNEFPNCVDFDPVEQCYYFDDISDDDPTVEEYKCPQYMHVDDYNELRNKITNKQK